MKNNSAKLIISVVFVVIGFGLVFLLSNFINNSRPPLPENFEDQDLLLQGSKIKGFTLGFNGLMADWYWMQALQYIGDKVTNSKDANINLENLRPLNPRLLYPLLDNATSLDPQFLTAYSYGAIVLPAIDSQLAIKIAEKGITNNPNEWRLYQHLGYIYWRLKDFDKASESYQKGSQIEGSPSFMRMMAAQMKTQGGSRQTARIMYQQMLSEAQDSQTKEVATMKLMQIDSLDEREAIQNVLNSFRNQQNRCINNWAEIFPMLKNIKLLNDRDFSIDKSNNLVDPSGIPYLLIKDKCEITLDIKSSKIPLQ